MIAFSKTFSINGRFISDDQPPFIIAEFSGNHNHQLDVLERMVDCAAKAGVDAIKLQTYTADTITLNSTDESFQIQEADSLWRGETLYSLYEKAHTPWEWHKKAFQMASDKGLIAFSSPFDESSVEFLESLDVPCYKIASFELTHFPLLKAVAATGKPVFLSTGLASLSEIKDSVDYLYKHGCRQLALLKCTSCYPAPVSDANLATIDDMKKRFQMPVGLSDHSKGIGVSIMAAGLGANIIERHFVLDHNMDAVDGAFSSTPVEFEFLVKETKELRQAMGNVSYGPTSSETESLKYRRSIYFCKSVSQGTIIDASHIKVVRPGYGLEPRFYESLIGRRVLMDVPVNTPASLDHFESLPDE